MQLPRAGEVFCDDAKVRDYLLSREHPVGRAKARFFEALGFRRAEWRDLSAVLLQLARTVDAVMGTQSVFGQAYLAGGILRGPNGRAATVNTV